MATRLPKAFPLLLPLLLAGAIYAGFILASPIPGDPNSPILYMAALTARPNLLSLLLMPLLGIPPSLVVFTLTFASMATLYTASLHLLRRAGSSPAIGMAALILPLASPFLNYATYTGLLMVLLPASLTALALTLALDGARRGVTVAALLVALSAFIEPNYAFTAALAALLWAIPTWRSGRERALNQAMLANTSFLAGLAGLTLVDRLEGLQPLPSPLRPSLEPSLYLLLAAVLGLGLYLAWRRDSPLALRCGLWILAALLLSGGLLPILLITAPLLVFLAAQVVGYGVRGLAARVGSGDEAVVEVDAGKLAALLLVGALLLSSVSSTLAHAPILLPGGSRDFDAIMKVAGFLRGSNASLLAPLDLLPWLSIYSGLRPASRDPSLLEAWSRTSFRVQSGSIRLDDWQPFSASRAPRLAIFDGNTFTYLLYIDDSYVRFTLTNGREEWVESPHGMAYLGHRLQNKTVDMIFQSRWLRIEKTLTAAGPTATITYRFEAAAGASVKQAQLSVFAEWPYTLEGYRGEGERAFITSGGRHFGLTGPPNSSNTFNRQLGAVQFTRSYNSAGGTLTLVIEAFDAMESGLPPQTATIFDFLDGRGEAYLVTRTGNPDRFANVTTSYLHSLYIVDAYQGAAFEVSDPIGFEIGDAYIRVNFYTYTENTAPLLSIVDAYMRASFTTEGASYTEAPSYGRVLREEVSADGRRITYETSGLLINKTLTHNGSSLHIRYEYRAKAGNVTGVEAILWLPWAMKYNYTATPGRVHLQTPMGGFNITYSSGLQADVGPQPPGGQPGIRLTGPLQRIAINITGLQPLQLTYTPTTRPEMRDADILLVEAPYLMGPWQEAPHGSTVKARAPGLVEAESQALSHTITYSLDSGVAGFTYRVQPKDRTIIRGGWALIWLNLDIDQLGYELAADGLRVAGYRLTWGPGVQSAQLTRHPGFGTPILNLTFTGELSLHITGELRASYRASPGPTLQDGWEVWGRVVKRYAESPSWATILEDTSSGPHRTIAYQTAGLQFEKEVRMQSNRSLTITYTISVRDPDRASLLEARSTLWIPWERLLLNYTITPTGASLTLDSGQITLTFTPPPTNISYTPTPQPSITHTYRLGGLKTFSYTITIESPAATTITYQDSPRPNQTGSDVLQVNILYGFLRPLYQAGELRVYQAPKK